MLKACVAFLQGCRHSTAAASGTLYASRSGTGTDDDVPDPSHGFSPLVSAALVALQLCAPSITSEVKAFLDVAVRASARFGTSNETVLLSLLGAAADKSKVVDAASLVHCMQAVGVSLPSDTSGAPSSTTSRASPADHIRSAFGSPYYVK